MLMTRLTLCVGGFVEIVFILFILFFQYFFVFYYSQRIASLLIEIWPKNIEPKNAETPKNTKQNFIQVLMIFGAAISCNQFYVYKHTKVHMYVYTYLHTCMHV